MSDSSDSMPKPLRANRLYGKPPFRLNIENVNAALMTGVPAGFVAMWPDAIGKLRVTANYGTNGGTALTRPAVAPASSDTVLVTINRFKSNGEANAVIDPIGLETRWDNDNAGRQICLKENYVEGSTVNTRVSRYEWHASGQMQKLSLKNSVTGDQITHWVFGTTLYNSEIADNDLIRAKIYGESDDWPDPLSDGPNGVYDRLEYTYNRQAQAVTFKDADETLHAYDFDKLARQIADRVMNLGAGLDASVLRIEQAYELRGMPQTVTSFDAPTGGSVVNQVVRDFDDFGNLIDDHQGHDGVVVPGTTPKVGYAYTNGSNNTMRRTGVKYPNGRLLNTRYGALNSIDDHLNRITGLAVVGESDDLVDYTYCGTDWQVRLQYPLPGIELTYIKQGAEPVGDGGDLYTGYDRFSRTIDIRWQKIADGTSLERLKYGFDRNSRRTWRQRVLATGLDNLYTYDGLSQVINSDQGILDLATGTIGTVPSQTEAWIYDPTGNWENYKQAGNGEVTLNQNRIHDRGNRLMQIEGDPNPIIMDRAGRMLETPPDASGDWNSSLQLVWDAWSRIVKVSRDGVVLAIYAYDGLTRRIKRNLGGVVWHSYYSDTWKPLEERQDNQTSAARQYLWGARHRDDLARRDRATISGGSLNETRYVLMDYFSPAAIADGAGSITERYDFSSFGIRSILTPGFSFRAASECEWTFGFQGQFIDAVTGFLNYGYRDYSAYLGRWLNKDPIEEIGSSNLYQMVANAPMNLADAYGLDAQDVGRDQIKAGENLLKKACNTNCLCGVCSAKQCEIEAGLIIKALVLAWGLNYLSPRDHQVRPPSKDNRGGRLCQDWCAIFEAAYNNINNPPLTCFTATPKYARTYELGNEHYSLSFTPCSTTADPIWVSIDSGFCDNTLMRMGDPPYAKKGMRAIPFIKPETVAPFNPNPKNYPNPRN